MNEAMAAPAPGRMPATALMAEPRSMAGMDRRHSSRVGSMVEKVKRSKLVEWLRIAMVEMIPETPKTPIATATMLSPSATAGRPKVKRKMPGLTPRPTMPRISPITTIESDFSMSEPPTASAAKSAKTMSEKYSAAPNSSAKRVSTGAKGATSTMPTIEPTREAMMVMKSATEARPFLSIG